MIRVPGRRGDRICGAAVIAGPQSPTPEHFFKNHGAVRVERSVRAVGQQTVQPFLGLLVKMSNPASF